MTVTRKSVLQALASAAFVVGWALLAHRASASEDGSDWGVASAVAPVVAMFTLVLWRASSRVLTGAGILLVVVVLAYSWQTLRGNVALLYYLQHVGINLALALLFGRSLFGRGESLVTQFARVAHGGSMTDAQLKYTRQVTAAWTLFFATTAVLSTALFLFASATAWSVFANLLAFPLLLAMFAGEHLVRQCVLPPADRTTIADTIRGYRQSVRERRPLASRR